MFDQTTSANRARERPWGRVMARGNFSLGGRGLAQQMNAPPREISFVSAVIVPSAVSMLTGRRIGALACCLLSSLPISTTFLGMANVWLNCELRLRYAMRDWINFKKRINTTPPKPTPRRRTRFLIEEVLPRSEIAVFEDVRLPNLSFHVGQCVIPLRLAQFICLDLREEDGAADLEHFGSL